MERELTAMVARVDSLTGETDIPSKKTAMRFSLPENEIVHI
jgi:hypothetical protein